MTRHDSHPSLEILQHFCDGSLPDFEQVALESHLVECEECMGLVSRMDALLDSGFTAEAYAAALQAEALAADPLVVALRQAAGIYREFAATIRDWLGDAPALWGGAPVRQLGQAALIPVSGTAAVEPIRIALLSGESRAMVEVREAGQSIEITSDAAAGTIALLFLPEGEPFVQAATLEPEGGLRVARFNGIPAGSYGLAIGPEEKSA